MNKLEKMASVDAQRWAAAEMFYGEGAGTRRKLLEAELQSRFDDNVYSQLFNQAYASLDMNKFAELAIKERKRLDRAAKAGRNFRAVKSGNLNNLTTGVFVVVGVGYAMHVTGYDKVALEKGQELYEKAKVEYRFRKARMQGKNVTKIV